MDILEVPEVFDARRFGNGEESTGAFADMVLTALLEREVGVLHAESLDTRSSVAWLIESPGGRGERLVPPVAESPSRDFFRSVLARFGHHYMGGQLYNGYALRFLRQRGRVHRCHIYMSNTGQSGFWIEVYSARMAEQAAPGNAGAELRFRSDARGPASLS